MLDTLHLYGDSITVCDSKLSLMTHGTLPRMGSVNAFVPGHDTWIGTVLMVCLVVLILMLAAEKRGLKGKLRALGAPAGSRAAQEVAMAQVTTGERWRIVLSALLLSVAAGALYMSWAALSRHTFCGIFLSYGDMVLTPVAMLAASSALCAAIVGLRRLLYQWVHATFFEYHARLQWRLAYRLSLAAEALSMTICACVASCSEIDTKWVLYGAILSVLLVKMALLWCAWRVFFVKKRAILHFFAYLCSAELIPLAILWQLLATLTLNLTV